VIVPVGNYVIVTPTPLGNSVIADKSSDSGFVGQRYEGFALDLSAYAATRVRTNEIEFWTTDGFQRARAVSHVYTPEVSASLVQQPPKAAEGSEEPVVQMTGEQITIFDVLGEVG
jgi:hypothetical protein